MSEINQQEEYFNAILQEYNSKLARAEHENILLRVENARLAKMIEELKSSHESNQAQV